jgi:hypothetical protein
MHKLHDGWQSALVCHKGNRTPLINFKVLVMMLVVLCFVSFKTQASVAPQVHPNLERGKGTHQVAERSQWDNVNLFNGNLNLALPLGQWYPLREGFGYQLVLNYNSQVWDYRQTSSSIITASPNRYSNAGFGWDLSMGRLIDPYAAHNELRKWVYISPDGALHTFYATLHFDVAEPDDNVFYTRDGTYYRLRQPSASSCLVESADGTVRTFELAGGEWRLTRIADRFTNYLAISYATPNVWTLTDNHGRTQTIYFKADPSGAYPLIVDRVVVSSFAGGTATYSFAYTTATVSRSENDNDAATSATLNVSLLTSVTAPDGSKHSFTYQAAAAPSDSSGRLASMLLPTMGKLEWAYQKYNFTSSSCASTLAAIYRTNTGIAARKMIDISGSITGAWSFAPTIKTLNNPAQCGSEGEMTNTVITPSGDKTVYYFSANVAGSSGTSWNRSEYALPLTRDQFESSSNTYLSRQIFDCDGAGANCRLLQSHYVRFQQDGATDPNSAEVTSVNRREAAQRTVYHDDVENGVVRYTGIDRTDFDGLGHFRKEVTNGNVGSGDVREQIIEYNASTGTYPSAGFVLPATNMPWLINTFSRQKIVEGNSSQVIEVCYDRATGFRQRQRNWYANTPNGAASSKDVFIVYTADAGGQRVKEQYYGGDVQSLDTQSLCTLPLPGPEQYQIRHTFQHGSLNSSQYYTAQGSAFAQKSIDRDIDRNTGLVQASRDSAGLLTQYEYDSMGRITWAKPQVGQGAWTQHLRTLADASNYAKTFVYKKGNGTGEVLTYKADVQDSFGRIWWEQTCRPDGTCPSRYTFRNAMGWRTHTTDYSNAAPQYTTYYDHDPFGRPKVMRPPDGASHDTTYQYAGIRSVKVTAAVATSYNRTTGQIYETPRATTKVYDRQGRLWKEITHTVDNFGSPRDVVTTHAYNAIGQLLETKRDGVRVGSLRTYDGRGFLASEFTEIGKVETLNHLDIDATGKSRRAQRHNHSAGTVSYLANDYDRAGRLIKVRDPNDTTKVWKEFTYADTNAVNDWRAGKLWKTKRNNDLSRFLAPHSITVAAVSETYTYGGIGGAVSKYETEMSDTLGRYEKFTQSYSYTELGDVAEIGYPNSASNSSVIIGRDRKVTYSYRQGLLTTINGTYNSQPENWATSIDYHPTGLLKQVVRANGVTDNIAQDPHGFARPASVSTSGAKYAGTGVPYDFNSGAFQYDGAGVIAKVGSEFFVLEQNWQPPTQNPPPSVSPCDNGWQDPTGAVYARGDYQCNPKIFYYYTAGDQLYKVEDGVSGEKNWYFYDLSGQLLTEYSTHHAHYQAWPSLWQHTRDYIYRDGQRFAVDEKRRDAPASTIHYHAGFGSAGIRTDASGKRIEN